MIELIAEDEDHFIELYLTTPRPFNIFVKGDFDEKKINEAAKRKGIFFVRTNIDGIGETICLPHKNQNSQKKELHSSHEK